jgi:protein TonB
MKQRCLLLVAICVSVVFHAGLVFLIFVSIAETRVSEARISRQQAFSLVNIASPKTDYKPDAKQALPPKPPSQPDTSLDPETLDVRYTEPAENYIEAIEEKTGEISTEAGTEETAVSGTNETSGTSGAQDMGLLTAEYVKRNYTYIQRRIRDRLVYPAAARRGGIQGVVEITFTIHEDGRVSGITVRKSSGQSVLDDAASATVNAAAPFPPPPAPARIAIPISFRLR